MPSDTVDVRFETRSQLHSPTWPRPCYVDSAPCLLGAGIKGHHSQGTFDSLIVHESHSHFLQLNGKVGI